MLLQTPHIFPRDLSALGVWKEDLSAQISYSDSHCTYVPENHWEEIIQEMLGS